MTVSFMHWGRQVQLEGHAQERQDELISFNSFQGFLRAVEIGKDEGLVRREGRQLNRDQHRALEVLHHSLPEVNEEITGLPPKRSIELEHVIELQQGVGLVNVRPY